MSRKDNYFFLILIFIQIVHNCRCESDFSASLIDQNEWENCSKEDTETLKNIFSMCAIEQTRYVIERNFDNLHMNREIQYRKLSSDFLQYEFVGNVLDEFGKSLCKLHNAKRNIHLSDATSLYSSTFVRFYKKHEEDGFCVKRNEWNIRTLIAPIIKGCQLFPLEWEMNLKECKTKLVECETELDEDLNRFIRYEARLKHALKWNGIESNN